MLLEHCGLEQYKEKIIMVFNTEELNAIPLENVLTDLGLDRLRNKFICPYPHSKPQQISVYSKDNICKCHNCDEVKGGPISVVMYTLKVDFKEACIWLSERYQTGIAQPMKSRTQISKPKKIEYLRFDNSKECQKVVLNDYRGKYNTLSKEQRLKMVYTYIYRFSLATKQNAKFAFYKNERGIDTKNSYLQKIGYIAIKEIDNLLSTLKKLFPMEDLQEFGVFKEDGSFSFKYIKKGGLILVPSFDLYTDMVTGFMIRPTHAPQWMQERGVKELQLSKNNIVIPIPFGLTCKILKTQEVIYITEGHIDLLSIPGNEDTISRAAIASPGTNGIKEEVLGLLSKKQVILVFDQDTAGQKAEYGYIRVDFKNGEYIDIIQNENYKNELQKAKARKDYIGYLAHLGFKQKLIMAGAKVKILTWDKALGGDVNELIINGNIDRVFA